MFKTIMKMFKLAGFSMPKGEEPLHPHDFNARKRLARAAVSRRRHALIENLDSRKYAPDGETLLSRGAIITCVRDRPRNAGMRRCIQPQPQTVLGV